MRVTMVTLPHAPPMSECHMLTLAMHGEGESIPDLQSSDDDFSSCSDDESDAGEIWQENIEETHDGDLPPCAPMSHLPYANATAAAP